MQRLHQTNDRNILLFMFISVSGMSWTQNIKIVSGSGVNLYEKNNHTRFEQGHSNVCTLLEGHCLPLPE